MNRFALLTLANLALIGSATEGGGATCATPVVLGTSGAQIFAYDTTGAPAGTVFNS